MKSQIYCLKSKPQFDAKWLPIDYKVMEGIEHFTLNNRNNQHLMLKICSLDFWFD